MFIVINLIFLIFTQKFNSSIMFIVGKVKEGNFTKQNSLIGIFI